MHWKKEHLGFYFKYIPFGRNLLINMMISVLIGSKIHSQITNMRIMHKKAF